MTTTAHFRVGTLDRRQVWIDVELTDERLSISGEIVARPGVEPDACGQITDVLRDPGLKPAAGWTRAQLDELAAIWDRWHLNNMQAACPHQRRIAARMGREPHQVFATPFDLTHRREIPSYDAMHGKQITYARVFCPICGYGYGTAWLREELPQSVRDYVLNLATL